MEKVEQERDFTCLAHEPNLQCEFERALKTLKGQVIPKILIKRVPYLVCTCKKRNTQLDVTLKELDLTSAIINGNAKSVTNNDVPKDSVKLEIQTNIPDTTVITDSNADTNSQTDVELEWVSVGKCFNKSEIPITGIEEGTVKCVTAEVKKPIKCIISDNPLLLELFEKEISVCKRRLLVIIYLCLRGETELLEPRTVHKEKVADLRKLNVKKHKYYYKKSKQEKYEFAETIRINDPRISVSAFVGKQGKNIKIINKDIDCKLQVNNGQRLHDIEIIIHAKTEEARNLLRQRVQRVRNVVRDQQRDWENRQTERARIAKMHRNASGNTRTRQGHSQWDIDEEQKVSARDHYSKNFTHMTSSAKPKPRIRKVLDEGARCLNCLSIHDKTIEHEQCQYHPGYASSTNKCSHWTCCAKPVHGEVELNTNAKDIDAQRESHPYNGCTFGRHNWRRTKTCVSVKCRGNSNKSHN